MLLGSCYKLDFCSSNGTSVVEGSVTNRRKPKQSFSIFDSAPGCCWKNHTVGSHSYNVLLLATSRSQQTTYLCKSIFWESHHDKVSDGHVQGLPSEEGPSMLHQFEQAQPCSLDDVGTPVLELFLKKDSNGELQQQGTVLSIPPEILSQAQSSLSKPSCHLDLLANTDVVKYSCAYSSSMCHYLCTFLPGTIYMPSLWLVMSQMCLLL